MEHTRIRKDGYVLGRDFRASMRVNILHWMVKETSGYLLHPRVKFEDDANIADVGTGTAIWLQELALKLPPQTALKGFDISDRQYPPSVWLPNNITLEIHDAFKPFPSDQLEKYDIVQARFLKCVVTNDNVGAILANLISLLKPDGYLQWVEALSMESKVDSPDSSLPAPASTKMAEMNRKTKSDDNQDWTSRLPSILSQANIKVLAYERHDFANAYKMIWAQQNLASLEELVSSQDETGAAQLNHLKSQASDEMQKGIVMINPFQCVVGQKTVLQSV